MLKNDVQLKIVEYQELYRYKDDSICFSTKSSYILIWKILYLIRNSVKCIIGRMTIEWQYVCMYSVYKMDYRGAADTKKCMVHKMRNISDKIRE